jgi:hypothetical protein
MGWWKRRKAERAYAALVARERDTWRLVATHRVHCVFEKGGNPYTYALFVAETNNLHERRVRMEYGPKGWEEHTFHIWADYKEWEMKAEARMPPRAEVEW